MKFIFPFYWSIATFVCLHAVGGAFRLCYQRGRAVMGTICDACCFPRLLRGSIAVMRSELSSVLLTMYHHAMTFNLLFHCPCIHTMSESEEWNLDAFKALGSLDCLVSKSAGQSSRFFRSYAVVVLLTPVDMSRPFVTVVHAKESSC